MASLSYADSRRHADEVNTYASRRLRLGRGIERNGLCKCGRPAVVDGKCWNHYQRAVAKRQR